MLKNKKTYAICMVIQTILPLLVIVFGILFIDNWGKSWDTYNSGHYGDDYLQYKALQDTYEDLTNIGTFVTIIVNGILGVIMFVTMIVRLTNKQREKGSVQYPLACWLYSNMCILGIIVIRVVVGIFTYGMSV